MTNFRVDIQALRGFAVLIVILNHYKLGFTCGYLGVDIFFVISGYLITSILKKSIDDNSFNFKIFYLKRAKRLLPAAYVVFICTAIISFFTLSNNELIDFYKQLIGSMTFSSNIFLWQQSDYFSGSSSLKPLLHIWSLSIEEQYYLLMPALLFFLPKRHWFCVVCIISALSLILCLILIPFKPTATFYLLPTRAWELGVGSLAALKYINSNDRSLHYLFWPALVCLALIPIFPVDKLHPRFDALLICISTIIIILRNHQSVGKNLVARNFAWVGGISYSLYLVHWPVIAIVNNIYIDEPSKLIYVLSLIMAFGLGLVLFNHIEKPFRQLEVNRFNKMLSALTFGTVILISCICWILVKNNNKEESSNLINEAYKFNIECNSSNKLQLIERCESSKKPELLVWGDSFAIHLVPGIISTSKIGVKQATKTVCGPFFNVAPVYEPNYSVAWAKNCIDFNNSVFDYLTKATSIKVVVMSSPFRQYLGVVESGKAWHTIKIIDSKLVERESGLSEALEDMGFTIQKLRSLGKKVVIVAPPPSTGFNIRRCLDRKSQGLLTLGVHSNCVVNEQEYRNNKNLIFSFLEEVSSKLNVNVISFDESLCSNSVCSTVLDGKSLYVDNEHLTIDGSVELAKKMNFGEILLEKSK